MQVLQLTYSTQQTGTSKLGFYHFNIHLTFEVDHRGLREPETLMKIFSKQASEEQNVLDIDYEKSQCNYLAEQETIINSFNNADTSDFSSSNVMMNMNIIGEPQLSAMQFLSDGNDQQNDHINHFNPLSSQQENLNSYDHSDQIRLGNSSVQFHFSEKNKANGEVFFEGSENGMEENMHMQFIESFASQEQQGHDKDSVKQENGRSDSMSNCSDQFDDDDDDDETAGKYRSRRGGKGPPAKNLMAERSRRKKLNDRLLSLRTLVPNISKLDKASILVDAIAYVKELQTQTKVLQDELEDKSDIDDEAPKPEHSVNGFHVGAKQNHNSEISNDNGQQMEVLQVQVAQIDGREFFVKVLCGHKPGGFVRLMEALDSLGLEVTNANVTSFRGLVTNVLKVEKKDNHEMVEADYVRESLLELTRDPASGWADVAEPSYNYHHHQIHNGHIDDSNLHLLHHMHN